MEVECPRHPVASTIGSLLLDETAPMAGKSWHPAMSPHAEGKKGTSYTDTIHTEQTREGRGGTTQNHAQMQDSIVANMRSACG